MASYYFTLQTGEDDAQNNYSQYSDSAGKTKVTRREDAQPYNKFKNSTQNSQSIQAKDQQSQEALPDSPQQIATSPTSANIEAQDPLLIEFESNFKCEFFFKYKSDEYIDKMLIDLGNSGTIKTQQELERTESSLKNGLANCKQRIDSKTFSNFVEDNRRILRRSAQAGNSIAQLRVATLLQQQSTWAKLTRAEKSELYSEHITWLIRASNKGNAEAKILLALAYLDPINYPEQFNLEEASLLVDEAGGLLGKDLKHLKDIINGF